MNPPTPQQLWAQATALHQAGRLAEAVPLYRHLLRFGSNQFQILNLLGMALSELGKHEEAVEPILRAIAINPGLPETHYNLGSALLGANRVDEAIAAYREAVRLNPNSAEFVSRLGFALLKNGQLEASIQALQTAARLRPDAAEYWAGLGDALRESKRPKEAIAAYRRSVALRPDSAQAHASIALCLQQVGELDESIREFQLAIRLKPDDAGSYNNLGLALRERGLLDASLAALESARRIDPSLPPALVNLGGILTDLGQFERAIAACRQAISLEPRLAGGCSNLATALGETGRIEEAIANCRQSLELDPTVVETHSHLLALMQCDPASEPRAIYAEHRRWNALHALPLASEIRPHTNDRVCDRRLRVGYVSPDFRDHPVTYFTEGLLTSHDPEHVEVFCYADHSNSDAQRLQLHAAHWFDTTGMNDGDVAELVRSHRIDILVDLSGHTAGNRLLAFARKPAPVQVTYLGYPNTTGLDAIDYRITDANADPPGTTEQYHAEQLVRLPRTFACYFPWRDAPAVIASPAASNGYVTFGSFHKLAKMNRHVIASWARILHQVPGSRLLMIRKGLEDAATLERLQQAFASHGIQPDRLQTSGYPSRAGFFEAHHRIDLMLDTFPVNGHTITCHALWMGVPVVSLAGATHISRLGLTVLNNLQLGELVAQSVEEYERIASELAGDFARLAVYRTTLRQRMSDSPLLDHAGFAREIEAAYRKMWRRWCGEDNLSP